MSSVSPQNNVAKHNWKTENVKDEAHWKEEVSRFTDVVELALEVIKKAKFPGDEVPMWSIAIKNGDAYALVTILLSQLHQLESLQLDYSFVWQSGFPGLMLKHALFSAPNGTMSKFNHLVIVDYGSNVPLSQADDDLSYPKGYPSCDPKQFMAWFHLSSVHSISIWLQNFQDAITSKEQLKQVNTLVLTRSTLTDWEIYSLLEHTPNLRSLHLGLTYHILPMLGNPYVLLDALELVSQTVERLSMSVESHPFNTGNYSYTFEDWLHRDTFQGFLKMFSKLRFVEVPITVLLNLIHEEAPDIRTVLPNTLEKLCLQLDGEELMGHNWYFETDLLALVRDLLCDLRSHSPALKRIILRQLVCSPVGQDAFEKERREVQADCALAGVDLQVVYDWLSPGLWAQIDHLQNE